MDFFSEDTKLSASYTLEDLTKTNQVLALPNLPTEKWIMDNLAVLADTLEFLTSSVGPFVIISGFRTEELQNALKSSGEPTGSGKSFHEVGRAVDIYPTTMDITEFFGRILANPDVRYRFAEISIKPSQNALHLAVNVPSDTRFPKILALNASNQYAKLTETEIQHYVEKYVDNSQAVATEIESQSKEGMSIKKMLAWGAAGAAIIALLV